MNIYDFNWTVHLDYGNYHNFVNVPEFNELERGAEIPTPQLLPGSSPESLIQYSNVYTMSAMLQSNLSTIPINHSAANIIH